MKTTRRSPSKKEARDKVKGTATQREFLGILAPTTAESPVLSGYECLPTSYLKAAYGRPQSAEDLITRFFYADPPFLMVPSGALKHPKRFNRERVYQNSPAAERLLGVSNWRQNDPFPHKIGRNITKFSFDYAAIEREFDLVRTPMRTFTVGDYAVEPDIPLFGYDCNGRRLNLMVEYDRGTESRQTKSLDSKKKTIEKMVNAYARFFEEGGYQDYGMSNAALVIVCSDIYDENFPVTPGTAMRSAMDVVRRHVDPDLWDQFLFTTIPDFTAFEPYPPANGHMLARSYLRVDGSEIHLVDYLERKRTWTSNSSKNSLV